MSWKLDNGTLTISENIALSNNFSYPWYEERDSIIYVVIEHGVTFIGDNAFRGCSSLTSVEIPSGVTSIGSYAFNGCSSLKRVEIPSSVTTISEGAFSNCSGLTSITIPSSVTKIGISAFYGCSSLTSITIPSSVTKIGSSAFRGCSSLESITIPSSVTSIDNYAFYGCSRLTGITIPSSVTTIDWSAFEDCSGLTSITVDENNTVYDSRDNCNAIIKTASNTLILGCQNTVIPSTVTTIGEYAFSGCSGLTSINIPDGVTSIGEYAFSGCSGLTSIEIPSGVTTICEYAFRGCCSLESITIPSSVTTIDDWSAFEDCSGLTSITVDENNTVYDSRGNCNAIIKTASNTLILGCQNTVIPSTVTTIGEYAFYNCSGLTSITIPSGVTKIGSSTFSDCSGLTSITVDENNTVYDSRDNCNAIIETASNTLISGCQSTVIPSTVTTIGSFAFSCRSSWESITIPSSVTEIGMSAFSDCSGLTSIEIPSSVTTIDGWAFLCCSGLTTIYANTATTPAEINGDKFYKVDTKNIMLYIPKGTTEAYQAAWGADFTFVEVPASYEYDDNQGDIHLVSATEDAMTITITPIEGYVVDSIAVNSVNLLEAAAYADMKAVKNEDGTYTISGLSGDDLVVVVNFSVSTPVNTISSNQDTGITAVYSLTGAYISKSFENLPSGMYMVSYNNPKKG